MMAMRRVVVAVVATFGAGLIASFFVDANVGSWYDSLIKPAVTPPGPVFAVVWIILYALMSAALALIWTKKDNVSHIEGWVRFYFIQLLFSIMWTIFFFGLHAMLLAFTVILFLAAIVACLIAGAWETDHRSSYLLIPYFLWVLFAAYLNIAIWYMN